MRPYRMPILREVKTQNLPLVALTVFVGLLWSGHIDNEMKWTATMFGLALAALIFSTSEAGRHYGRRR